MAFIMLSPKVIAPPAGADVTTMEGLRASLHLFEPKHFLFPFLAHAFGTLTGALVGTLMVKGTSRVPAYTVGCVFLIAGITNVMLLPAPLWFNAVDLIFAYLPAAWLGDAIARQLRNSSHDLPRTADHGA